MSEAALHPLEAALGYAFQNRTLLQTALTHSSFANERRGAGAVSNERLEFLGDSILNFIAADYVYTQCKDHSEGDLTKLRALLVCEQACFSIAQALQLGSHLRLGKGEERGGGRTRVSILADAAEALIGALYLDGGMHTVRKVILPYIAANAAPIIQHRISRDYKSTLQEITQQNHEDTLRYELTGESGPEHEKLFSVTLYRGGVPVAVGTGPNKKAAEQDAARQCLAQIAPHT